MSDKLQLVDKCRYRATNGNRVIDKLQEVLIKLKVFKAIRHSRGAAKDL